jgi:hypothetical protein
MGSYSVGGRGLSQDNLKRLNITYVFKSSQDFFIAFLFPAAPVGRGGVFCSPRYNLVILEGHFNDPVISHERDAGFDTARVDIIRTGENALSLQVQIDTVLYKQNHLLHTVVSTHFFDNPLRKRIVVASYDMQNLHYLNT